MYFDRSVDSQEINTLQILDKIHCIIFHSFEILNATKNEKFDFDFYENEQKEENIDLHEQQLLQMKSFMYKKRVLFDIALDNDVKKFERKQNKYSINIPCKKKSDSGQQNTHEIVCENIFLSFFSIPLSFIFVNF